VLVHEKKWPYIAEMLHALTQESPLRQAVLEGQRQRIQRYETRDLAGELRHLMIKGMER